MPAGSVPVCSNAVTSIVYADCDGRISSGVVGPGQGEAYPASAAYSIRPSRLEDSAQWPFAMSSK